MSLLELIPVIGGGMPLFSFLYTNDLEQLKLTCKTLKTDVEVYEKR